jgi:RNA recognition motif-containing protein
LFLPVQPEKAAAVGVEIYVGNLPRSMTGRNLASLFRQAGEVSEVDVNTNHITGGSEGYAYVTMSAQSEADKAVSLFDRSWLEDHQLKVMLVRPREQRGFGTNE